MCLVAPSSLFQVLLYRQNLAAAREPLPLARNFTARDRILVLAPHCDDETLGAGGTIAAARARGTEVTIVFLTNGDASLSTKIGEDARSLRRHTYRQLVEIRQREALSAAAALGVAPDDVIFLGYPDCGTKAMWETNWSPSNPYRSPSTGATRSPYENSYTRRALYCGQRALRDVRDIVTQRQPTVIITTHPADTHPDHWAAYGYAEAALQTLRLDSTTSAWARRTQLLTFLVHHGVWPAPHGYHPDAPLSPPADLKNVGTEWVHMPLSAASRTAKKSALQRYTSQLTFTPRFLRGFLRRNELLGEVAVAGYPGLHSSKPSPETVLQDPVRDSLLHEVWPSADMKAVQLVGDHKNLLTVRAETASAVSTRLKYQLIFHTIGRGATSSMKAWRVTASFSGGKPRATLARLDGQADMESLEVRMLPQGFEFDIPRRSLRLTDDSALLVSSTTQLGNRILDQTQTGTIRFLSSTRQQPQPPAALAMQLPAPLRMHYARQVAAARTVSNPST